MEKMKVEIELDVEIPIGYKAVKYNTPKNGDYYLNENMVVELWDLERICACYFIILEKAVKHGKDLIGCLCGVSNTSLEHARINSEDLLFTREISLYDTKDCKYEAIDGLWKYAYPVSKQKLKELMNKIEKDDRRDL